MKHYDFELLVTNRLTACQDVLKGKDKEYSSDTDRLHNFKKAATIKGKTAIAALDGMWLKHRVSLEDMLDRMAEDEDYCPSKEIVQEKIGDNINYSLLFEALIEERRQERTSD